MTGDPVMSPSRLAILLWALLFDSQCSGQTTNAACNLNQSTSWLFNANVESPCLVWARLQSLCIPSTSFINVPPLLDASFGYTIPQDGTVCQCNVVSYALMAGCTWCQLGDVKTWPSEADYKTACGTYVANGLGFAESVQAIPAYAWRGWNGGQWDVAQASTSATSFASTKPSGTTTLSRSFPPSTTTVAVTSDSGPSGSPSSSTNPTSSSASDSFDDVSINTKWSPIIGGIAGGVGALIILFLLYRRHKYKRARQPDNLVFKYAPPKTPRSRGQSLLGFFAYTPSEEDMERDKKRATELMNDPKAFRSPRPAPKAPSTDSLLSLRYTTTQERMRAAGSDDSVSVRSAISAHEILQNQASQSPHQNGGLLVNEPWAGGEDDPLDQEEQLRDTWHRAPPQSTDFSRPHPFSASDIQTLPSMYELQTGVTRYTNGMDMTPGAGTPMSPESRYPATDAGGSVIGEALGTATRRTWDHGELPPLPEEVAKGDGSKKTKGK